MMICRSCAVRARGVSGERGGRPHSGCRSASGRGGRGNRNRARAGGQRCVCARYPVPQEPAVHHHEARRPPERAVRPLPVHRSAARVLHEYAAECKFNENRSVRTGGDCCRHFTEHYVLYLFEPEKCGREPRSVNANVSVCR